MAPALRSKSLANGVRLHYAEQGDPGGVPVVMLHGITDSWRSFEPVMNALPSTVGAISVSLRGFGGSDAPPDGYTPDDFAADVHDLAEHEAVKPNWRSFLGFASVCAVRRRG